MLAAAIAIGGQPLTAHNEYRREYRSSFFFCHGMLSKVIKLAK